jgi:cytidine deaminase
MKKENDLDRLIEKAKEARKKAYASYSNFLVGAAVIGGSGKIFTGCNIENSSFGLTICAERVALFKAVSEGEKEVKILALVTDTQTPVWPCGACRQVLAEFDRELLIVSSNLKGQKEEKKLSEIFPEAFDKRSMKK